MKKVLGVIGALLLLVCTLTAQLSTSSILGTVRDASGAVVPGAKVTATNTSTNTTRTTESGSDGLYRIDGLTPGVYNVTIEKQGYSTEKLDALTLSVAQNAEANVALKVGSVQDTVQVEADSAPQVNVTSSTLGGLVNDTQVAELPLNGRNFIDLALLQPGVANAQYNSQTLLKANYFSANGAPVRSNLTTLDGAPMINVLGSTSTIAGTTLGVDGIQEFRVITNTPGAQYGIGMGSQIVIQSKGGSNQFHGDVFDYLRNDKLDAWGYFANTEPVLIRNNFGGAFGGPIVKDKTFFFATYEGLRQIQGVTNTAFTLGPTQNYYSGVPNASGVAPVNAAIAAGVTNPLTQGANPGSTAAFTYNGTNYNCASGCATTSGAVNPTMAPFIPFYPYPNVISGTTYQYVHNNNQPTQVDYGQIRVDQTFSAKDSMFGRFTMDESYLLSPVTFVGTPWQQVGTNGTGQDQWDSLVENHVFSPTLLNTGRISYSRTLNKNLPAYPASFNSSPYQILYDQPFGGITQPGNLASISTPLTSPQGFNQNLYSASDDLNWSKGKHAIQIGALLNRVEYYLYDAQNDRGSFTYTTIANFMAGSYQQFTMQPPGSNFHREPRFYTYGFYVQDDWRYNSRLTFNLGLRYEINSPVTERRGNNWAFRNITDPQPINSGSTLQDTSYRDFEPRAGFAWDVKGDGKTAVHAGFGVYDDVSASGQSFYGPSAGTPPTSVQPNILNQTIQGTFPYITSVWNLTPGTMPYGSANKTTQYFNSQPRVIQYNFSIQQQITPTMTVTLAYAGSKGMSLWDNEEGNPCQPDTVVHGIPSWTPWTQLVRPGNTAGTIPTSPSSNYYPTTLGTIPSQTVSCNIVTNPGTATADFLTGTYPANYTYGTGQKYIVSKRINPLWGDWILATTNGLSNYNAGEFSLVKRTSHGLEAQVAYTFGKVLDEAQGQFSISECAGSGGVPEISLQPERRIYDYGPACFDIKQQLQASVIYHFPKTDVAGFIGKELLSGWWMANKTTWQTGAPFSPVSNSYRSQDGNFTSNSGNDSEYVNYGTATVVPGATGPDGTVNTSTSTYIPFNKQTVYEKKKAHTGVTWFNPLMFTIPSLGQLGTVHKAQMWGPTYSEVDLSLSKDTALPHLGEKGALEFRAEAFNLFNHSNFAVPAGYHSFTGALTSVGQYSENPLSTAGLTTTTVGPQRQLQVSLKLLF